LRNTKGKYKGEEISKENLKVSSGKGERKIGFRKIIISSIEIRRMICVLIYTFNLWV
jgi:hypothetical protein